MSVQRGLDTILSGGTEYLAFEEGKPVVLLFIDWYEDLVAVREHYEPALNPKYIKCPGKEVCPLCKTNPDKYAGWKVKFRVYDPVEEKVKVVSLAKTHIKKLNTEFNLDEIDPTQTFVKIYRSGKGASDTSYSARVAKGDFVKPNLEELDMPDLEEIVRPHTPEEIQGFMDALLNGATGDSSNNAPDDQPAPQSPTGRKMPF